MKTSERYIRAHRLTRQVALVEKNGHKWATNEWGEPSVETVHNRRPTDASKIHEKNLAYNFQGLTQRILSPAKGIVPDLTKRDEQIFTGLAAVKVTLRPVTSRDKMSSS